MTYLVLPYYIEIIGLLAGYRLEQKKRAISLASKLVEVDNKKS